jgi:hypothetical protein
MGHLPLAACPISDPAVLGSFVGTWIAKPGPGVAIEARLEPNGQFVWKALTGSESKNFTGTDVLRGDNLVFTRTDGHKKWMASSP